MALFDIGKLEIKKVIIHDVPKHKIDETEFEPIYSENECEINDKLRLFFQRKINSSLASDQALRICFDKNPESQVPIYIKEILQSEEEFIPLSCAITKRLFEIQTGSNSSGLIMIVRGILSKKSVCLVLKLERDKGAQVKRDELTKTFIATEIDNLLLTEKNKVFKTALFINKAEFKQDFDGILSDNQNNLSQRNEISSFFMSKFLGCKPFMNPKATTKKFYDLTSGYIDSLDDPIDKAKYYHDLKSYVQKNQPIINPDEFANDYLKNTDQRNEYKNYLEKNKFSYESFEKDISYIKNRVEKSSINFTNGVTIIGTKKNLLKDVKLTNIEGGDTKAEIVSKIKKMK
jgi:hypothetical protein